MAAGAISLMSLGFAYGFGDRLPLAAQRAISFLPGIRVQNEARQEADATWEMRRIMRSVGMKLAPEYFWFGRGFGQSSRDYSSLWDPTGVSSHVYIGRFYNGFVGLLVNTGILGTCFMLIFLSSGTVLAWKMMQVLRVLGCGSSFLRMCSVVTALWLANVIAFLFMHGDSEWAMKTFSLQAGMLISCRHHLKQMIKL